eukprot:4106408-Prymnesium_polylepis.2
MDLQGFAEDMRKFSTDSQRFAAVCGFCMDTREFSKFITNEGVVLCHGKTYEFGVTHDVIRPAVTSHA